MKYILCNLLIFLNVFFSFFPSKNLSTNISESNVMFDSSRIEFVFDKDCYTDEYFTSNIKITRLKESSKEFTIYLSIINDGFIYSFKDNPNLKFSKLINFLNYNFSFSINKSYLVNNFKFRIDYSYLDSYKTIFIPFSSDYVICQDRNKFDIYYKAVLSKNSLKTYYSQLDFNYIDLFKNQIYYDFLKFKYLKVLIKEDEVNISSTLFEIEDKSRVFKNICSIYDFDYACFPLNFKIIDKTYEFFNSTIFYIDQETFLEHKEISEKYNYPTKNIYFPNSFYEYFSNCSCSLIFELNSYLTLKFNFILTIENCNRTSEFEIKELNEGILYE